MNEGSGEANSSVLSIDTDLSVRTVSMAFHAPTQPASRPMARQCSLQTRRTEIVAFDYDGDTGELSNRRLHASFKGEPGLPDGSCVDAEGGVWNAEWEGRRVVRVAPTA
jgi:L-arabinonolactonase